MRRKGRDQITTFTNFGVLPQLEIIFRILILFYKQKKHKEPHFCLGGSKTHLNAEGIGRHQPVKIWYSLFNFNYCFELWIVLPPSVHLLEPSLRNHFYILICKYYYRQHYTSVNGPFITQINIDMQIFVNVWYRIFHLEFKIRFTH